MQKRRNTIAANHHSYCCISFLMTRYPPHGILCTLPPPNLTHHMAQTTTLLNFFLSFFHCQHNAPGYDQPTHTTGAIVSRQSVRQTGKQTIKLTTTSPTATPVNMFVNWSGGSSNEIVSFAWSWASMLRCQLLRAAAAVAYPFTLLLVMLYGMARGLHRSDAIHGGHQSSSLVSWQLKDSVGIKWGALYGSKNTAAAVAVIAVVHHWMRNDNEKKVSRWNHVEIFCTLSAALFLASTNRWYDTIGIGCPRRRLWWNYSRDSNIRW